LVLLELDALASFRSKSNLPDVSGLGRAITVATTLTKQNNMCKPNVKQ